MKYYVISKFFDNGKITTVILLESEYAGQTNCETKTYDQYVDVFETFEAAEAFCKEALNA